MAYSPLLKRLKFCRSIYVKKVMKLLAFIFEQPSYKDNQYPTTISYCTGYIVNVEKTSTENSVSIREIDVQTSYKTASVGSQTEYQLMYTRGNINPQYCSIMAIYINLIKCITLSISKPIKV